MVAERFPQVRLFPHNENIGFVRANNWGMSEARGQYFLLLNPDTEVHRGALASMMAEIAQEPRVGILGPQHRQSDGSHQSTRRRFPNAAIALLESTWLQPLAPRGLLARYCLTERDDEGSYDVDWVQGSALLARRAIWENIGGLDERYKMYFEEVDWCARGAQGGLAGALPRCSAHHAPRRRQQRTGADPPTMAFRPQQIALRASASGPRPGAGATGCVTHGVCLKSGARGDQMAVGAQARAAVAAPARLLAAALGCHSGGNDGTATISANPGIAVLNLRFDLRRRALVLG